MKQPYLSQPWQLSWREFYPLLCLIFLSTAPAILLGEGDRNLGLIVLMLVSPLFMFIYFVRSNVSFESLLLMGFVFSIIFFQLQFNINIRWSTIFYTLMFSMLFICYDRWLSSGYLSIITFSNLIYFLIIAYTAVLLIQQFCVIFGFPIFNLSNYDPNTPWKLNALSPEPSHSARIVGLLMVTYVIVTRLVIKIGKEVRISHHKLALVWCSFFWTMITMVSATSVIMIVLVVLAYAVKVQFRNYLIAIVMLCISLFLMPEILIERSFGILSAISSLDYETVLNSDHSAGVRLAPILILLDKVEIFSFKGLFGHGIDSVSFFMSKYIWGVPKDFSGGGMFSVWYEYGFISFILFILFTLKATDAITSLVNFLVWVIMIFIGGINTQMLWLTVFLLYTLKFYSNSSRFSI
jgi:hypothetical protein